MTPLYLIWEKFEIGKILGAPLSKKKISSKHLKLPKNHFKTYLFFVQLKHLKSAFTFVKTLKIWPPPLLSKSPHFELWTFWFLGTPFGLFPLFGIFFLWLPLRIISNNLHCRYFTRKITRFFGVDSSNEDQAKTTWVERRRRMAIKKLGGVKVAAHFIMFQQWPWTIYSFEFPSNSNSRIYKQNHGFWKCK